VGIISGIAIAFFSTFLSQLILGISIGFGAARLALKVIRAYNFSHLALIDDTLRLYAADSYRTRLLLLLFSAAVWKIVPVVAIIGYFAVGILSGLAIEFYRSKQRFNPLNKTIVRVFV